MSRGVKSAQKTGLNVTKYFLWILGDGVHSSKNIQKKLLEILHVRSFEAFFLVHIGIQSYIDLGILPEKLPEQSQSFYLFKALDEIKSSQKSFFFLQNDLSSFMLAQHVLSYHQI